MVQRQLLATVSGSFRQHMTAVQAAVYELTDRGVTVLSPADPRVVDQFGDFVFVASDRNRSIGLVEDRHLSAISASDFLWLVSPDGYIGTSAALEVGYAVALKIPVFSANIPVDLTFRRYVIVTTSLSQAIDRALTTRRSRPTSTILLDPPSGIARARRSLDTLELGLLKEPRVDREDEVRHALLDLGHSVGHK
jgi:hypothetical protein